MYRTLTNSPLDHSLETGLEVLGEVHSIDSLRQPFLDCEHAAKLAAMPPRWKDFHWVDQAKFIDYMGPDVDPIQHGPYQARTVAIPMVEAQIAQPDKPQLADEAAHHFVAYTVIHDDHEGLVPDCEDGDRALTSKTLLTEAQEMNIWQGLFHEVYQPVNKTFASQVQIMTDHTSSAFEHTFWDVSERIGYVYTGFQAFRVAYESECIDDLERVQALAMARQGVGKSLAVVERSRDNIVFADEFLIKTKLLVGGLLSMLQISIEELRGQAYEVK